MSINILINSKLNNQGLVQTEKRLTELRKQLKSLSMDSDSISGSMFKFEATGFQEFAEQGKQAILEQINLLKQHSAALQQSAQGAQALGRSLAGETFMKRKAAIDGQIGSLQSMISTEEKAALMVEKYAGAEMASTAAVQKQVAALRQKQQVLENASRAEFGKGNIEQASILSNLSKEAGRTADAYDEMKNAGEETDFMTNIMNSSFNKFGFTLFITISTLQQVVGMLQSVYRTAEEGAAAIDKFVSFNANITQMGGASGDLAQRLQEAGRGAVSMETAMEGALRLMKADLPAITGQSDALLKVALNAAIVEGNISDVNRIYETLITGIIRGEPRLIDNAGIILKVGKSVEEYAASLGKTTEQLNESEKAQAVFNAVMAKADVIEDMADNMDSLGETLQVAKNQASEVGLLFKSILADGLATVIELVNTLGTGVGSGLVSAFEAFGASAEIIEKVQFATSNLSNFVKSVFVALDAGLRFVTGGAVTLINNLLNLITEAWARLLEFSADAQEFIGLDSAAEMTRANAQKMQDSLNHVSYDEFISNVRDANSEFATQLGIMGNNASNAASDIQDPLAAAATALSSQLDLISDKMETAFDPLSDANINKELSEKRLGIEEDFSEKMADIRQKLSDKLADISEGLNDKLVDIARDRKDKLLKITQDLVESQTEINEDLAEKLSDISSDTTEKAQKAREDANEEIEQAEEDHQKKLNDIQRKYELARLNALIDRDARALFEAEQNRKTDLEDAEESAKDKRDEVTKELEKQLEDIAKAEEKQREDAIKAAEKRREDAVKQYEKQRREAQEQYEKARTEAKQAAEKARQDAIEASSKERRDAQQAYSDKLNDLQKWHNDQLIRQQEAELKRLLARAKEYEKEGKLTQDHINELSRMWDDYNNSTNSAGSANPVTYNPVSVGGSGGGTSSGGGGGYIPGAPSNQPTLKFEGGQWVWVYPDGTRVPLGGGGQSEVGFGTATGGGTQQVNITVSNDKTLEQIFKEISYEAVVEVVQ